MRGSVFSYRLIDFIDPDYRLKELLPNTHGLNASDSALPPTFLSTAKQRGASRLAPSQDWLSLISDYREMRFALFQKVM